MARVNVEIAYATCADITRHEARNFSYGIALLPPPKRRAMAAVYATARRIDDIGDGDLDAPAKLSRLAEMRDRLRRLDSVTDDPVLVALSDAAQRLPIPVEAFEELIDGCEADVTGTTYTRFDELVGYCRCVAGSIGRLSVGVYDPPERDRARGYADTLGVALQLTNILRDLREDRLNGRVYLPQQDLDRFGCRLEIDGDGRLSGGARFLDLVRFEADRAEQWYVDGLRLLPLLDRRSAACTAAMAGIYRRVLREIAADPDAVRSRRLSLPARAKVAVAARALARAAT